MGFVVFEDVDTADEALAGMEGEEISGKEIRVKRARSFYIRKVPSPPVPPAFPLLCAAQCVCFSRLPVSLAAEATTKRSFC